MLGNCQDVSMPEGFVKMPADAALQIVCEAFRGKIQMRIAGPDRFHRPMSIWGVIKTCPILHGGLVPLLRGNKRNIYIVVYTTQK